MNKLVFLLFVCLLSVQSMGPQAGNLRWEEEKGIFSLLKYLKVEFLLYFQSHYCKGSGISLVLYKQQE